jgi:hypothetical protein
MAIGRMMAIYYILSQFSVRRGAVTRNSGRVGSGRWEPGANPTVHWMLRVAFMPASQ